MIDLNEMRNKVNAAQVELSRVCANNFTMKAHIPVQPDDSDEIIDAGLSAAQEMIAEIAKLRHKLELAEAVVAMAKYTVLAFKRALDAYDAATAKANPCTT